MHITTPQRIGATHDSEPFALECVIQHSDAREEAQDEHDTTPTRHT